MYIERESAIYLSIYRPAAVCGPSNAERWTSTQKGGALHTCMNYHARPLQSTPARGPGKLLPGHGRRLHPHLTAGLSWMEKPTQPRTLVPAIPQGDLEQRAPEGLAKAVPQASTTQRFGCFYTPTQEVPTECPLDTRDFKHRLPQSAVELHSRRTARAALSIQGPARLVSTTPPTKPGATTNERLGLVRY